MLIFLLCVMCKGQSEEEEEAPVRKTKKTKSEEDRDTGYLCSINMDTACRLSQYLIFEILQRRIFNF